MVVPCPNCGRSQDGGRYCQDCGGALPASAATQPPPTDQKSTPAGAPSALGKVPAGAWVGLAAVVLILVLTAAVSGSLSRGSASDQPPSGAASGQPPSGAAGPLSLGQPFGSDDGYITLTSVNPSANLFARFEVRGRGEGLDCPDESTTYLLVGTRRYDAAGLADNDQCLHVNDGETATTSVRFEGRLRDDAFADGVQIVYAPSGQPIARWQVEGPTTRAPSVTTPTVDDKVNHPEDAGSTKENLPATPDPAPREVTRRIVGYSLKDNPSVEGTPLHVTQFSMQGSDSAVRATFTVRNTSNLTLTLRPLVSATGPESSYAVFSGSDQCYTLPAKATKRITVSGEGEGRIVGTWTEATIENKDIC